MTTQPRRQRFLRGFSDPAFEQGHDSEHDRAMRAMGKELERLLTPHQGDLRSIEWQRIATLAFAAAELEIDSAR
jgi:hypothetical protein